MSHFFLLKKLQSVCKWLNVREATENDCWQICNQFNIIVRFAPLEVRGYYGKTIIRNKKRYYIFLDSKLKGIHLLAAFLHEIGHVLLHEPKSNLEVLYCRKENSLQSKQDKEADIFMLLALLPFKKFIELSETANEDFHPFTLELLQKRAQLFHKLKQ